MQGLNSSSGAELQRESVVVAQRRLFYSSHSHLLVKFRASHVHLLVSSPSSHPLLVSIKIPIGQKIYASALLASVSLGSVHDGNIAPVTIATQLTLSSPSCGVFVCAEHYLTAASSLRATAPSGL